MNYLSSAERTIALEADAITRLRDQLTESFARACEYCLSCTGRVVVTGMGKSGHIGHKIAATLASTGTPAFFMHPAEASHGDLGMLTSSDVVLALSNSGTSAELVTLLPVIKRLGIPLISMTGDPDSVLAQQADEHIQVRVETEACPLNLAPTSSTTAALVMGDALAIALLEARGFSREDFAFSHPGGALGRRLLLKVDDIMHSGDALPVVSETAPVTTALLEMTAKRLGFTTVLAQDGQLVGVFSDGDLRRAVERGVDLNAAQMKEVMTVGGTTVRAGALAAEAVRIMQDTRINAIVVMADQRPIGVLNMQDLLQAGVV
ncbi:MAG: KpsF/GutQ family sugar-phosphate isomerase [Pseudomonadales bacterium]|nr:KpsF/GutQ family sugar-phosphate isomerase [Gammaproteobacteria bacterium]